MNESTTQSTFGVIEVWSPDGTKTRHEYTGGYDAPGGPSLDDLRAFVGGYIETVPRFAQLDGQYCVVFCNEEGKLNGLPVNVMATRAWAKAAGMPLDDVLVGPVAICMGTDEFLNSL